MTFLSERGANTVFTLHPYVSGRELAMFFPEEPRYLTEEVDRYHKVYTSPEKWNSSSPYEQTFQHLSSLIVLYRIAPGARQGHIDGFFGKSLDERRVDPSGWIFCRGGNTYVAVRPLRPYQWIEEAVDWRFRSMELRNGVVVQAASASDYPSFEAFMTAVRATRVKAGALDPDGGVVEGAMRNVFAVLRGVLVTPPLPRGLLPGITRGAVLEVAGGRGRRREARDGGPEDRQPVPGTRSCGCSGRRFCG